MALGLRRAKKIYRWFKSRLSPGVIILGYHRIADTASDSYNITVSAQHFNEQMEMLQKHANIINLTDLHKVIEQKLKPIKAVAITVDDGYTDVLNNALPILERYAIPAAVFITTGFLGKEFWWDKLNRILAHPDVIPDDLNILISDRMVKMNLPHHENYANEPSHSVNSIYDILLRLPFIEIENILTSFTLQVKMKTQKSDCRCMSEAELAQLVTSDLIEVGSHSVSHPFLAQLSVSEQRYEIEKSKSVLQDITKRPVRCFSYPNGSFSNMTMRLVQESGYQLSFSSEENMMRSTSNPLQLPRFWMPDWNGDQFGRWLKIWTR